MTVHSARNTIQADPDAIDALVGERAVRTTAATLSQDIPLAQIRPSPTNPRTTFDEEAMSALTASVAEHGVLEPIVVRRRPDGSTEYELIAGERRWRASRAAGLTAIPCRVIIGVDDRQALELQALENLQRADLNPVEEAQTFRQLADAGLKQAAIARTVGKSQPYVANRLRLLDLPPDTQALISAGQLTAAHGVSLARFAAFPEIASVMAAWTVKAAITSKELDRNKLPFSYELTQRKLIAEVGQYNSSHTFDTSVCEQCPYQAYRNGNGTWQKWCLKPSHAAELHAAAQAEREQEHAATIAAVAAASPDGQALRADSLKRDAYTQIFDIKRPAACTDACPCIRQAVQNDYRGNPQIITICTDPERYAAMQRADQANREAMRRKAHDAEQHRVLSTIAESPIDSRSLALLVLATLTEVDRNVVIAAAERQTAGRAAPPQPPERWQPDQERDLGIRAILDQLAALDQRDLVRFALDALLSDDLHDRYLLNRQGSTSLASWYLGDEPPASPAAAAADPSTDDEDEEYPRESDLTCDQCDEPITVKSAELDAQLARHVTNGGAVYCGNCDDDRHANDAEDAP